MRIVSAVKLGAMLGLSDQTLAVMVEDIVAEGFARLFEALDLDLDEEEEEEEEAGDE
jgi:hypothetical protein